MSDKEGVVPKKSISRMAREAVLDIPRGTLGGLVAQQRRRAMAAETRAWLLLGSLVFVVITGLAYYLLLPFWEQLADSRRNTIDTTISAIDSASRSLDIERSETLERLAKELDFSTSIAKTDADGDVVDIVETSSGNILAALRTGEIIMSKDDAKNFSTVYRINPGHLHSIIPLSNGLIFAIGWDGEILRSTDNGATFDNIKTSAATYLEDVVLLDTEIIIIFGRSGIILRSTNDGESFKTVKTNSTKSLRTLEKLEDGSILLIGDQGTILRSENDGASFETIPTDTDNNLLDILLLENRIVLVFGKDGTILRSENNGLDFLLIESGTSLDLANPTVLENGAILVPGNGDLVLRSEDKGLTFKDVGNGGDHNARGIGDVFTLNDKSIFVTSENNMLRSTDGGTTFFEVETNGDPYLMHVLDSGTILLPGNHHTLFRSTNGGLSFDRVETNASQPRLGDRSLWQFIELDDGSILGAGDGGVLIRSIDDGESFVMTNTETINDFRRFHPLKTGAVLVSGFDESILRVTDSRYKKVIEKWKPDELDDKRIADFLSDVLPLHVRARGAVAAIERDLGVLRAKRSVLDERKSASLVEREKIKDVPWALFRLQEERERFDQFMTICRGRPSGETLGAGFDSTTVACANAWQAQKEAESGSWWRLFSETVPPGVLLLFLLATLGGLYRYNLKLAGFHHSRADALVILASQPTKDDVAVLSDIAATLAADKVEFGKSASSEAAQFTSALSGRFAK